MKSCCHDSNHSQTQWDFVLTETGGGLETWNSRNFIESFMLSENPAYPSAQSGQEETKASIANRLSLLRCEIQNTKISSQQFWTFMKMLNTPNETKLTFKIESIFSRWIFVCAILTCKLVVLVVRSEKMRKNKILSNKRWYLKETLFSQSRSINLPWIDVLFGVWEIIYIELYRSRANGDA